MPNHVYNIISVEDKYADKLKEIAKVGLCRYYMPMPDFTVTPVKLTYPEIKARFEDDPVKKAKIMKNEPTIREGSWWDWCIQNWGTKWGCYDGEYDDGVYRFTTAWSPIAERIIKMLLKDIPTLDYEWEEEQGFGAFIEYVDGEAKGMDEWDLPEWDEEIAIPHPTLPNVTGLITRLKKPYRKLGDTFKVGWYAEYSEHEFLAVSKEEAIKEFKKGWVKYEN